MRKDKPHIICHMMSSLDGRILSANWGNDEKRKDFSKIYEDIHDSFESDAWICGRITMEKDFSKGRKPGFENADAISDRDDYVAEHAAKSYAVAVDASGKLGWDSAEINGDHLIEVLTENVDDKYLGYLQRLGISYIFAGKESIDFAAAVAKLGKLFSIKTLMLEGGGHLNGSFLNAGLIDELSLLLLPLVDGTPKSPTTFEVAEFLQKRDPVLLKLTQIKQLEDGVLWLTYKFND